MIGRELGSFIDDGMNLQLLQTEKPQPSDRHRLPAQLGSPSVPSCAVTASARLSWNLRVTPEDQALIDRAVSASGLTRTDFVLQAARLAAQELLIEQTWLSVGAEPYERFAAALDAPPHANERLRRTMAAPRPWQS